MKQLFAVVTLVCIAQLSGCIGALKGPTEDCNFVEGAKDSDTLYILSYDILAFDDEMIESFEQTYGYSVEFILADDAGGILNQLMLTKGKPQADLAIGLDNTYMQTAIDFCLLKPHNIEIKNLQGHLSTTFDSIGVPFDYGYVCLNLDSTQLNENLTEPTTIDDLTQIEWRGKVSIPSPLTSSPGRAFFFSTLMNYDYNIERTLKWWTSMKQNDLIITTGWTESYEIHYSGGYGVWTEGHIGDAAITVSYCHSPGVEAYFSENSTVSTAILYEHTHFKQIEYATMLNGQVNSDAAKKFIQFLLTSEINQKMPTSNYMYSVLNHTDLPAESGYKWNSPTPQTELSFDQQKCELTIDELLMKWSEVMLS
jgi:thiamine transport system substrate-binding protein